MINMELKVEIIDQETIRLYVNKDLLNILMESTLIYVSCIKQCFRINKEQEDKKTIEIADDLLLDIMINTAAANEKEIKLELNIDSFKVLRDVVVCSADALSENRKFKNKIDYYKSFGQCVQRKFKQYYNMQ